MLQSLYRFFFSDLILTFGGKGRMKKFMFIALFLTAFMFPFFGSISNADALGSYGCYYDDRIAHVDCLRGKLDTTAYGLTIPKGSRGLGNSTT